MHTNTIYAPPPLAYDVNGLAKVCGRGRSRIMDEIAAGRLIARRAGGKLVVLHDDARAWLQSLPLHEASKVEAISDAG